MASSSTPVVNPLSDQTTSKKLTKNNHTLWKMQVLAVVGGRGGLEGYLTKDTPPPAETIRVKNSDGKEEVPNPKF
jgi:hypothetical protein